MSKRRFGGLVFRSYRKRQVMNILMCLALLAASVIAIVPLFSVFGYVLAKGLPAVNWSFFTELPKPVGEVGGGMANAMLGTVVLVLIASIIGVPWGMVIGIYLSEYGRTEDAAIKSPLGRLAPLIRFSVDMLASVPSIIIGLFVYAMLVMPMRRFSALAGGVALAILMVPTIARTTEELLKLVPDHIREAGLALGLPRWKVVLRVVLRGSMGAIITGVMLALARVAGETAPLLFTAFGNHFWQQGLDQPIASLPVQIYNYAISPYDDWHRQAWAGAFVLVFLVFFLNILIRLLMRRRGEARE